MSNPKRKVGQGGDDTTTIYRKAKGVGDLAGIGYISHGEIDIAGVQDLLPVFAKGKALTFPSIIYPEAPSTPSEQTDLLPSLETNLDHQFPQPRLHLEKNRDCCRRQTC